jgi:L-alanine-DL-glutamate epimerase-like enolase superfamily enzyme
VRITSVESFGTRDVALVRVRTDEGADGWGQVAPYHADITTEVLHRQVAPHALGRDPLDVDSLADEMYEPRPRVIDGMVEVPSASGWGVEISAEWLSHSEHRVSRFE